MKVWTYWCKETIEILCYFNWVSDTAIFIFFWRILSHVYLAILFWNLFYYAQNNVDSKFVYFASLVQLFYSCIFVWFMLDQFLLLIFCFYHLFIKFIPFFVEVLMPLVIHSFDIIFFSLLFTVLIGACLPKVLLLKRKKVSKPRFTSLFSVTNDQSNSHSSVLNASSLKFL